MSDAASPPDLYGLLNVERTASVQEIRLAFRAKASIYHPDVPETGDQGKFAQITLARDILTNPRSRENYDAIGAIEIDADNEQAYLMTVLIGMFGQTMGSVLRAGKSPSNGDFIAAMNAAIKAGFDQTNQAINNLTKSILEVEKLDGRFSMTNFELPNIMQTVVEGEAGKLKMQIDGLKKQLHQLEAARLYLTNVLFKQAPAKG